MKLNRAFAGILASTVLIGTISVGAFAADTYYMDFSSAYDEDGYGVSEIDTSQPGYVTADYLQPGKKYYIELPAPMTAPEVGGGGSITVDSDELSNSRNFNFKLKRDQNGKYLKSVKFVGKRLGSGSRENYIEIVLKENTMTDDAKVTFDVYFQAKRDDPNGTKWVSGDRITARFSVWVQHDREDGTDADIEAGDGIVFNAVENENNTIIWGQNYEIASLEYSADDDPRKFFAKLSTKIDRNIYERYGDPIDAELFFRSFVGNPKIDSTSRAVLTLYNPWDEDYYYNDRYYYDRYRYGVDPRDCYIYEISSGGVLTDVTDRFTYVHDDTLTGLDGWQTRTRVLGNYVISDKELDLSDDVVASEEDPAPPQYQEPQPTPSVPVVSLPPTGASAVVAGVAASAVLVSSMVAFIAAKRKK